MSGNAWLFDKKPNMINPNPSFGVGLLMRVPQHNAFWRFAIVPALLCTCLTACSSTPQRPHHTSTSNACVLFQKHPSWYWEALQTYNRWQVPISVQMAIMQRESDFQAGARPQKKTYFGFIPSATNLTSAYGYAQALNGTWKQYQNDTKRYNTTRDQFGDASDFIGWYCNKANKTLKIQLNNAYSLYLAYHEGLAGYANQTYKDKPWLLDVAVTVQDRANEYRQQIRQCKFNLPR
jgi:hypothetical protein